MGSLGSCWRNISVSPPLPIPVSRFLAQTWSSVTVTLNPLDSLEPGRIYYYDIRSVTVAGDPMTRGNLIFQTFGGSDSGGPSIDVWYGAHQRFGHVGNPQRRVNILGRVSSPHGVYVIGYRLNGGRLHPLPTGPTAFRLLGGLEKSIAPGEEVMIKPNFNCAHRSPLSTEISVLKSLIEVLLDFGAKVWIGESSGRGAGPTAGVVERLDLLRHIKWYGIRFVNFDEDEWIEMEIPGRYWGSITVPRSIYEAERRIYLSNARCHSSARLSCQGSSSTFRGPNSRSSK